MALSTALGEYLRARRELLRPEDVSLPNVGRRRVPGLRREELAMLAGISSDYYLRLEQGRDHHPSAHVIDALARALQLDEDATAHLHSLSQPTGPRRRTEGSERAPESVTRLIASWSGTPAFVQGRHMDVLAANALASAVSPVFSPGVNIVQATFLDPEVRRLVGDDWDTITHNAVARLRPVPMSTIRTLVSSWASCRLVVLTLTSFGLVRRCQTHRHKPSDVVALWKDPGRGKREISLEAGAQGILLSANSGQATRRSFDGRRPVESGRELFNMSVFQVRASAAGSRRADSPATSPAPPVLEVDDLTILTSWAEAAAEALAVAPERLEELAVEAHAGAPWRAELGISEPCPQLNHAISGIFCAVRRATATGGDPPLQALTLAMRQDQPGESDLDRLVHRVLRSALEQRQIREASDGEGLNAQLARPPQRPDEAATEWPAHGQTSRHQRPLAVLDGIIYGA